MPYVREFDGSSYIVVDDGSIPDLGFGTYWAIIKRNSIVSNTIVASVPAVLTNDSPMSVFIRNSSLLGYYSLNIDKSLVSAFEINTSDGWVIAATSKSTGTAAVRMHKKNLTTGVWTHVDGASTPPATPDEPNAVSGAGWSFGGSRGGNAWHPNYVGRIFCVAYWDGVNVPDATLEGITSWLSLLAANPTEIWRFDQADTSQAVVGFKGTGADQTIISGTTVQADSIPNFDLSEPQPSIPQISKMFKFPQRTAPQGRTNLASHGPSVEAMMNWLGTHPQAAYVPEGVYLETGIIDIPIGADVIFDQTEIIPQDPANSCIRFTGPADVRFRRHCRIGTRGQIIPRGTYSNAESTAILFHTGSHDINIYADDLLCEGLGSNAIFCYRSSHNIFVDGFICAYNTGADSFHITGSSHDIDFAGTLWSIGAGDDCFAVVSYAENVIPVSNVRWHNLVIRNQRNDGRGISVVGGTNVTVDNFDIDGTTGAAIYIAAEGSFDTLGVDGVLISGGKAINPNTHGIHHGYVVIFSANPGYVINDVDITGIFPASSYDEVQRVGSEPVTNTTVNGVSIT